MQAGFDALALYVKAACEEQQLLSFFMPLRDGFKINCVSILHHNPHPSVEAVFSELLAEEACLTLTQVTIPHLIKMFFCTSQEFLQSSMY